MKFIVRIILGIILIPLIILLLLAINLRFQFLSPAFWQEAFDKSGTYSTLSTSINAGLVSQTVTEGGSGSDVKVLTDMITPANLKEVVGRNIDNVLMYANGKAKEIVVYIPVNKFPKSFLPKNVGKISEQMKLVDLLKEFNMSGISVTQIEMISRIGLWAWLFLAVMIILVALVLFILYIAIDSGKRLVAPGVAFIFSGAVLLFVTLAGMIIRINWAKDLAGSSNLGDSMIGIIAPPIIGSLIKVWLWFGIATIVAGIILLFIRKPIYTKSK